MDEQPGVISLPRISVVLCTYKGTAYLGEQLRSLLVQTRPPDELIVCDDRSPDDTVQMLHTFRQSAPFPVHITVNPLNLGSTRNFDQAIELATGDYLALCDQDDIWFPDKLATLAKVLDERPEVAGVFSNAVLMGNQGSRPEENMRAAAKKTLWDAIRFDPVKQQKFGEGGAIDLLLKYDLVTGATLMVRASARPLWHPIPATWVHDAWIAWMLSAHSKMAVVPRSLMAYRIHPQQQLGLGGMSFAQKLKRVRETGRARYVQLVENFEFLRDRLSSMPPVDSALQQSLQSKIEMLRRRAALPRSLPIRITRIAADLRNYKKYARGWRSMRKDLLIY